MSISTILAVLAASRLSLPPVGYHTLERSPGDGIGDGIVLLTSGFSDSGVLAGVVMISQISYLSGAKDHQGIAMGLFLTTSYLGMACTPVPGRDTCGYDRIFFCVFCHRSLRRNRFSHHRTVQVSR